MVDSLDRKIFDAGDAVEQIKLLRMNAKDAFSGAKPDNRMGIAYREAADALEQQIEAGIRKSGNPNASQILKDFRDARKHGLPPVPIEALENIASKLSRICVGNAMHAEHWDDIAGYAMRVSEWIRRHRAAANLMIDEMIRGIEPTDTPFLRNCDNAKTTL